MEKIVSEYFELVRKSIAIVRGITPFESVVHDEFALLTINGNEAKLTWPQDCGHYDDIESIETQSKRFPAEHLKMTNEQIDLWVRRAIHANDVRKSEEAKADIIKREVARESRA